MAKQIPWDEETDNFISDLDDTVSKSYSISLRSLLMNPGRYLNKKDLGTALKGIRTQSDSYFNALLDNLKDEQTKLESEMESMDAQYRAVDTVITNKSAAARVPYIKPLFVTRAPDREEAVIIEKYEENLDAFVGKLVNASNYVADVSALYKQYRLGSWIFSGAKNHVLTINPPTSPVLVIENSRAIIGDMLSDIEARSAK
ncbi:MAG: hypothetical protein KGI04_00390 [Candidatus Micrarchaeota archaeon]|nr:hypothetical protein [Candidatus Micrarchaeota archaeon]